MSLHGIPHTSQTAAVHLEVSGTGDHVRAVDCQGFAGGFTLGMVQAGFTLVGKKEMKGGFGVRNCLANRHLLGYDWQPQVCDPAEWTPISAAVVFGNPPCSGFSVMSNKHFRGPDSSINSCMWAFADFVARTNPYIAVFESVQQAYSNGLELMRGLRAKLEADTGERWELYHILHNNASVGGAAIRKRYFWLVSRIPFGIEMPDVQRVPNVMDVIGDLGGLADTYAPQPYRRPGTWWSEWRRRPDGLVDGHAQMATPHMRRCIDLMSYVPWNPGEHMSIVVERCYRTHGVLPPSWGNALDKLVPREFFMGYTQPKRWRGDKMGRVVTGAGAQSIMHPVETRFLTQREIARVQGFVDDWRIQPLQGMSGLNTTWGKGIPVDVGRWIGGWIRRALEGEPGTHTGQLTGDREHKIDCTHAHRLVSGEL